MDINKYLEKLNKHYQSGHATEHTYRGDFASLISILVGDVNITNEPSNVTDCGNPDYVITRNKIPIGFIEAKDIGKDLNSKSYKEQFERYKKALDNLIITDYVWFKFFQQGELVHEIRIAHIDGNKIKPLPEFFEEFTDLIQNFCTYVSQTIKSPKKLAEMMAAKARLLENILEKAITNDEDVQCNSDLQQQYDTFKEILIHDLTPQGFADIYAQTLAYGMFAARLHDKTLDTFSRQEAAELIPKSNPFLRKLFEHLAGANIDERIVTTVDNLADVFRATNVEELLKNFGRSTQTQDPIIHFYETFLAEYDPKLRKARGVWYTPEPIVNFIVRGVDEILRNEFGLKDGLSDTTKTLVEVEAQGTAVTKGKAKGKRLIETKEVHKVQVLDPATGTGTFLSEVVKFIYSKKFKKMQGAWSSYVEEHLIPRLNGFELLMASYSMAHLKLDMLLSETGYITKRNQRFNIFLTNSLEEHHPDTGTLFATWLSTEANEANHIKRDSPVMVVMGNPPYSGESANKSKWIMDLMDDYKKEPGGKEKLKERNPKWINDDYVKFLRYGQYLIEKNGEGVLAFINPHGFLDNPTFRGVRWNLLKTFDKIYTLDLHGNSKKKEVSPDGSPDVNVFDIQQGVSINFFVKTDEKKNNELGKVFHFDLYGSREYKYQYLRDNSINSIIFNSLPVIEPMYFMVQKDFEAERKYNSGFSINDLFRVSVMGFQTHRDKLAVAFKKNELEQRVFEFVSNDFDTSYLVRKFSLKNTSAWNIEEKRRVADKANLLNSIFECSYRPFDNRFVITDNVINDRPRKELQENVSGKYNLCLLVSKQQSIAGFRHVFISDLTSNDCVLSTKSKEGNQVFPLYLYQESSVDLIENNEGKIVNFNKEIIVKFSNSLGCEFCLSESDKKDKYCPDDVFEYVYAILHSNKYRIKYQDFLKSDFPKIPYPDKKEDFRLLVELGKKLKNLHLFNCPSLDDFITSFPMSGDNIIANKIISKDWEIYDKKQNLGRIWINELQYFEAIPENIWNFYIGGYQPAQKWLKERVGRKLSYDDIFHFQKIIVALSETDRIMKKIDKVVCI